MIRYALILVAVVGLVMLSGCGKKEATPEEINKTFAAAGLAVGTGDFTAAKEHISKLEGLKLTADQEKHLDELLANLKKAQEAAKSAPAVPSLPGS